MKNSSSKNQSSNPQTGYQQSYENTEKNRYSDESDYGAVFTNVSSLNTYPHGNYINDYNTVYSTTAADQYRPLSAVKLDETNQKLEFNEKDQNDFKYVQLDANYLNHNYLENQFNPEQNQLNQPEINQYQQNQYNELQKHEIALPPAYQQFQPFNNLSAERSNDYIINTPYPVAYQTAKPNKNLIVRCCGQLFSIFLVVFMLLLSLLLIQSFRANLTANYIARHNQNEWHNKD